MVVMNICLLSLSLLSLTSSENTAFNSCFKVLVSNKLLIQDSFNICFDEFSFAYSKDIVQGLIFQLGEIKESDFLPLNTIEECLSVHELQHHSYLDKPAILLSITQSLSASLNKLCKYYNSEIYLADLQSYKEFPLIINSLIVQLLLQKFQPNVYIKDSSIRRLTSSCEEGHYLDSSGGCKKCIKGCRSCLDLFTCNECFEKKYFLDDDNKMHLL